MNKQLKQKLSWTTVQKQVQKLIPQDVNPRKISEKQMKDLTRSLKKFNLVEIPAVDIDGKILAGHQRITALILLGRGDEMIDVRIPNRKLTETEVKQYLIGSNKIGGDWDFELLKTFETDILTWSGFDDVEITKIWDNTTPLPQPDESFDEVERLKNIKKPRMNYGDIAIMGKHRLICGDSTDPTILQKLCQKDAISMIYSDPVYNINVDYNKGIGGKQSYGGSVQDNRTDMDYLQLLDKSLTCALDYAKKDTHVFYWCDQKYIWLIQTLYQTFGIDNKRVCLWIKNGHNPTPGVAFHKCYEPCVYGTRGKPFLADKQDVTEIMNNDINNGNNSFDDIWTIKRLPAKEYAHATSKPPALHYKAIQRCTRPNDIILDSFSGSGSTLIAGEQLGRIVYGVELEPEFCELIIQRWESLTGKKAEIIYES